MIFKPCVTICHRYPLWERLRDVYIMCQESHVGVLCNPQFLKKLRRGIGGKVKQQIVVKQVDRDQISTVKR